MADTVNAHRQNQQATMPSLRPLQCSDGCGRSCCAVDINLTTVVLLSPVPAAAYLHRMPCPLRGTLFPVSGVVFFRFDKDFHVSPFMSMKHTYDWRFSPPSVNDGSTLTAQTTMLEAESDKIFFDAKLVLKRYVPPSCHVVSPHVVRVNREAMRSTAQRRERVTLFCCWAICAARV